MWKKELNSFKYAFNGLAVFFKTQPHARFHLFFAVFVGFAGWFFEVSTTEWLVIVLTMTIVLVAEAMNTALEFLTDLVSPDYHPLAGKVKDVAAGAVLLASFGAILIGFIIFFPKLLAYLFQFI